MHVTFNTREFGTISATKPSNGDRGFIYFDDQVYTTVFASEYKYTFEDIHENKFYIYFPTSWDKTQEASLHVLRLCKIASSEIFF